MSFDNVKKDFNKARPFHRVGSPTFDIERDKTPADGKGFDCGCRAEEDFPADSLVEEIARAVVHTVPGWVPVPLKPGEPIEKEIEGFLVRSFQTWTDNPVTQFHDWYDWNFYIEPIPGYRYVKGLGNKPPVVPGKTAVSTKDSMEGEWDCGSLAQRKGPKEPGHGPMFNNRDLWWPQAGHYTWISGRWIYDCGHSDPPGDNKLKGVMRSELHPVKALACARWEGFKFKENGGVAVPAIQFLFVASKLGGYKQWRAEDGLPPLTDRDYEFIVDLPKIDAPPVAWGIGHTPENPFNTGVLRRPHLLRDINFSVFDAMRGTRNAVQPIITPIPRKDPTLPPEQVRVKIPMSSLPPSTEVYGFILSMGWLDPDRSQAAKVKEVTVTLKEVETGSFQHDKINIPIIGPALELLSKMEWQLRIGVNGRWIETPLMKGVGKRDILTQGIAGETFRFFLPDDEFVRISSHGVEVDPVGDFIIDNNLDERTLFVNGVKAQWEPHIVIPDKNPQQIHDTCVALINRMASTFNIQNEPLGLIDPGHGPKDEPKINPHPVKDQNFQDKDFELTAFLAQEVGELAELVIDPKVVDYKLRFKMSIKPQALS